MWVQERMDFGLINSMMQVFNKKNRITDLESDSLRHILSYLTISDVFACRRVNRFFLQAVDDYLSSARLLVYDLLLNGVCRRNGEYQFNVAAFDFILEKMHNVRVIRFETHSKMLNAVACCSYDLTKVMVSNCRSLEQLHLPRCRGVSLEGYTRLTQHFAGISHLTVSVYNELHVGVLVGRLPLLKYFSLDKSVLADYGRHLVQFGDRIETFVAAEDHDNHKNSVLRGLIEGNGKYLKHLDLRIFVFDEDDVYFNLIGQNFTELQELRCTVNSRRIECLSCGLLGGLGLLKCLEQLEVRETLLWEPFLSVVDDKSVTTVLKSCRQLTDLTLASGKHSPSQPRSAGDDSLGYIDVNCPLLQSLTIKSLDITDVTIKAILRLPNLNKLCLNSLPFVTDSAIIELASDSVDIGEVDVVRCPKIYDSQERFWLINS